MGELEEFPLSILICAPVHWTIILVTTLSSRGRGFTSSENYTNHSCSYNVAEYKSHCSSLLVRELKYYEKDIVVSKNTNVSEESALFSEHNGENSIFLACLIPLYDSF